MTHKLKSGAVAHKFTREDSVKGGSRSTLPKTVANVIKAMLRDKKLTPSQKEAIKSIKGRDMLALFEIGLLNKVKEEQWGSVLFHANNRMPQVTQNLNLNASVDLSIKEEDFKVLYEKYREVKSGGVRIKNANSNSKD